MHESAYRDGGRAGDAALGAPGTGVCTLSGPVARNLPMGVHAVRTSHEPREGSPARASRRRAGPWLGPAARRPAEDGVVIHRHPPGGIQRRVDMGYRALGFLVGAGPDGFGSRAAVAAWVARAGACFVSIALAGCGGSSSAQQSSGGTATGGDVAVGGTSATGGIANGTGSVGTGSVGTGSSAGTGGAGGTGAVPGTGGNAPVDGNVGTLGQPCSPIGALACAGNAQKLTVLCGGDGTWQPNLTCDVGEFCDSRDGVTVGTCLPVDPLCDGQTPRGQICDGERLIECGPDLIDSKVLEECNVEICGGMCPVPCPEGEYVNCDPDCGEVDAVCRVGCRLQGEVAHTVDLSDVDKDTIVRLPAEDELCECYPSYSALGKVAVPPGASVSVDTPWALIATDTMDCAPPLEQCAAFPAGVEGDRLVVAPIGAQATSLQISFSHPTCP